jgi:GAF domain-containing protein
VRVVPATHAGAVLGVVLVARVPGAERFEAAADAALAELGGRVGVVLRNRQLDAALQATLEDLRRTNEELRASGSAGVHRRRRAPPDRTRSPRRPSSTWWRWP